MRNKLKLSPQHGQQTGEIQRSAGRALFIRNADQPLP
jgi:hypothetical protein